VPAASNKQDARIILVKSEDSDWTGLYINGCLVYQNHSLDEEDVLQALLEKDLIPDFEVYRVNMEALEYTLPQKWTLDGSDVII
jgi:hypothetical protein